MRAAVCSRTLRVLGVGLLALLLGTNPTRSYGDSPAVQPQTRSGAAISNDLLSNSQFVFGPAARNFETKLFLEQQKSPLLSSASAIESWCAYASVNPQVVLTLLELNGGQVTQESGKPVASQQRALSVEAMVMQLAEGFYAHLYEYGERSDSGHRLSGPSVRLSDGSSFTASTSASSGTYAVLDVLAQKLSPAEFQAAVDSSNADGFAATWRRLFPASDPLDASVSITPEGVPPADLLQFPFPMGQTWWFNGAHNWNGSGADYGRPYSSIDFFTAADSCISPPANDWAVAAAAGIGYHPGGAACWYRIDHGSGWSTSYYHLLNVVSSGAMAANDRLGTIACQTCVGGFASGPHVHFSLLYNGAYVDLEGVSLSGWIVHMGSGNYSTGSLERGGVQLKPYSSVLNDALPSSPKTPTSTSTPTLTATCTASTTPTSTPPPPSSPTATSTEVPAPGPTSTSTPSSVPSAQFVFPQPKGLIRVCPVTLVAQADVPGGASEARFRADYGGSVHEIGTGVDGPGGWQVEWDCQDAPDGAATLSLDVIDSGGREVITGGGTTPVTLSKGCAETTYRTAFFANTELAASPASSWCKASSINYGWGTGSPGAGVPGADNFSARFRGNFRFDEGTYEFSGQSDDGVRIWIDRSLQLDDWYDHGSAESFRFVKLLHAGVHEIRLDYYERRDSAAVSLDWQKANVDPRLTFLPMLMQP